MDTAKLEHALMARGEPRYRLGQILEAVYKRGASSYAEITSLPAPLRDALEPAAPILSLTERTALASADRRAVKAALALRDGLAIETVLLKPKPGDAWTVCLSCQAGCAVGCTFCATGLMGLKRSLSAEEIVDQVLFWAQYLRRERVPGRVTNVVYMGMGEPFHCYETVAESIRALADPARLGLAQRHIAVSTSGLAPGIERFADDFPQASLALSLHAGDDELRSRLVPVNKAYPLARLAESLRSYLAKTNRRVFLEYVLLAGENDGPRHADQVVSFAKRVGQPHRLHVNLIVFNPTRTSHAPSAAAQARAFRARLEEGGLSVTIRKNLGQDIQGACGQLIQ
ncbi:MAG: 23S rRNA (adenine(2503)-C(2))-methyltransferase RlmN [Elusimicrobia bacterium]|nr:23S rRNA (adenine(2503)-C(2))-methyltransferase RlmN [Elusimicrobiota bacterium]